MDNKIRNRIFFLLPPVILTVVTCIWYFYDSSRWYSYRQEFLWGPLLFLHVVFPLLYFVAGIVCVIKRIGSGEKKSPGIFYIVASFILTFCCFIGLVTFLLMTSGA